MASTKFDKKSKYFLAKLADKNAPCAFCRREADEETIYGKLYSIGNIHCHYFCVVSKRCYGVYTDQANSVFTAICTGFIYYSIKYIIK